MEKRPGVYTARAPPPGFPVWSRFSRFGTLADTRSAAVIGRLRTGERRPRAAIGCHGHHATDGETENKPSRGRRAEAEPERGLPASF